MTQKTIPWRTLLRLLALACCVLLQGHPAAAAATANLTIMKDLFAQAGGPIRIGFLTVGSGALAAGGRE